jgi:hypothetical protein
VRSRPGSTRARQPPTRPHAEPAGRSAGPCRSRSPTPGCLRAVGRRLRHRRRPRPDSPTDRARSPTPRHQSTPSDGPAVRLSCPRVWTGYSTSGLCNGEVDEPFMQLRAALPDGCGRSSSQGRRPVVTLCHREDGGRHLVDAGLASHIITRRAIERRLGAHPRAQASPNVRTYRRETCHRDAGPRARRRLQAAPVPRQLDWQRSRQTVAHHLKSNDKHQVEPGRSGSAWAVWSRIHCR